MDIIKQTQDWCKDNDSKLLYLIKFGSHLYGTDTPKSDTDYKGIFLPSAHSCYLNRIKKSLTESTGDRYGKNTVNDIDIQLWSLQYFLNLVSTGETNALDLLYSHTYPEIIIYKDSKMDNIFSNHQHLFSSSDCNSYTGYAINQAKKYGIKGTRLGVLKKVYEFLHKIPEEQNSDKVGSILPELLETCQDASYCFSKAIDDKILLVVCGKVHQSTITISELKNRVFRDYIKYGERAELAAKSKGVDWKALSHAMRAIYQMEELLTYGKIQYPLASAPVLTQIKTGHYTFPKVEQMIIEGLRGVDTLITKLHHQLNIKNQKVVDSIILSFYE